jgi:phosphoribosylamine--glycine ligase
MALKLSSSELCTTLYIAPGNPGTASCGQNVKLSFDAEAIETFIREKNLDLIIVGPEQPLVDGLRDDLEQRGALENCYFFGPGKAGAQLEGSKSFAKAFMLRKGIPTAGHLDVTIDNLDEGRRWIESQTPPYVLKADGLAAGKGVVILEDAEEAKAELEQFLSGRFGEASSKVVLEEFLSGREFSVFVATNGSTHIILPVAKDYKRIGEGDTGPNTGGMGSVSPVSFVTEELMDRVRKRVVLPTLQGLAEAEIPYTGFIFFGLIEVAGDPYVIEYNVRMGDPETQSVMARIEGDLLAAIVSLLEGREPHELSISQKAAATVVLVSEGYPGKYEKGMEIQGTEGIRKAQFIHAGTVAKDGRLLTSGGRVAAITATGESIEVAITNAYNELHAVQFKGMGYRKDIGKDLL